MKDLKEYRKNVYSQHGEDGVIEEILRRLNIKEGTFVEFGAWDGINLSNTYNLLKNKNWSGLYIEGDKGNYQNLLKNMRPFGERVQCLNTMVEISGENRLDNILKRAKFKKEFTLLSIDIDSYDFHVWESLKNFYPKIVIIEIDAYISPGVRQIFSEGNQKIFGTINPSSSSVTSFSSMIELGKSKKYTGVCHTTSNLIFVQNKLVSKLNIPPINISFPEAIYTGTNISYFSLSIITRAFYKLINLNFITKKFYDLTIANYIKRKNNHPPHEL